MVAVNGVNDIVVEAVEFLQERELLPDVQELRMLSERQAKKLLAPGVRDVLTVQVVKAVLS